MEEAVALSMGKNPEIVNSRSLSASESEASSPFRNEYKKRAFLVERARQGGCLGPDLRRDDILKWFSANDIDTPAELIGGDGRDDSNYWKKRCLELEQEILSLRDVEDKWHGGIKKSTYHKAILGIAMCAYGHRPTGGSPAPLAIERDLALLREQSADELKLNVGDDNIRKILDDACRFLSISWGSDLDFALFEAWKQKNRGRKR